MNIFAGVAVVVLVGFWILFRQWSRGRGSEQFVLSSLPLALLFLVGPVPLVAVQSARAFQSVTGHAGARDAADWAIGIARPLLMGSIGFLAAIVVAAVLQMRAMTRSREIVSRVGARGNLVLVASSLLALPVGLLTYLTQGIAPLIMRAGVELAGAAAMPATVAGMTPTQFVDLVSTRILRAGFWGFPLLLVVFLFGIGNQVAAGFSKVSSPLVKYSWAVFAVTSIAAAWNIAWLTISIRSFEQASR
jgi:hypothetical protein